MLKKITPFLLILLLSLSCLLIGSGLAWGLNVSSVKKDSNSSFLISSVDKVPERYQNGLNLYLETCSTCHLALPPEVLPMETWQVLLEKPNDHYGTSVNGLIRLTQLLIWDYLRTYSRPLTPNEPVPLYTERSRYFKALHPRVTLPDVVTHKTCLVCHPAAENFNFRTLTPEWENSP